MILKLKTHRRTETACHGCGKTPFTIHSISGRGGVMTYVCCWCLFHMGRLIRSRTEPEVSPKDVVQRHL